MSAIDFSSLSLSLFLSHSLSIISHLHIHNPIMPAGVSSRDEEAKREAGMRCAVRRSFDFGLA
jgi:hypothetical protein